MKIKSYKHMIKWAATGGYDISDVLAEVYDKNPEYLSHVTSHYPEVIVYALRLDRGLSTPKAINSIPGTYWNEERGLNEKQYIVPGAGGLGEVINNSYV